MPTLRINKKLEPFLTKPKQLKIAIGGRGSGKSIGIGDALTFKMATEKADIYCLREFQDSISDSVHRVFEGSINDRLMLDGWNVQEKRIISPEGAQTAYKGAARNPNSIQSAQGYKYSWFEEAQTMSQASIDKLLPTILRNPGAECWFSANPQSSADPFSQRFIVPYLRELNKHGYYEDDLHLIIVVNWRDNPWWNIEQETLRKWDYTNLSRAKYDWVWEGKFNDEVADSIVKAEWFDACIDAHKVDKLKEVFKPLGARIAAHDPSDTGKDNKGYAMRHGSIVQHIYEKNSGEIDVGCDWATNLAREHKADWFVWDGDGMGAGLKRQVANNLDSTNTKYQMFKGSLSGKGQDHAEKMYQKGYGDKNNNLTNAEVFKNNRAQYYISLADRCYNTYRCVVKGEYVDPEEMISFDSDGIESIPALRSELCRIPRKNNSNGLQQLMNKQEMKSQGIDSPGMADSLMMLMFQPPVKKARKALNYGKTNNY
jgi:phage terminase large subunit